MANSSVEQTLGQQRVRAAFNPTSSFDVDKIKEMAADFIDFVSSVQASKTPGGENARLAALAQTHIEDAAMWAVKLATSA